MDDIKERQEFEASIIRKARSDEAFKQRLLADPRATLEAEMKAQDPDSTIPEGVTVRVVEEAPTEVCLVLPLDPQSMELGDDALDAVAGGGCHKTVMCDNRCLIRFGCGGSKVCGEETGCVIDAGPKVPGAIGGT